MAKTDLIYPSCVVNLRLRFDETFRVTTIPEPGPQGGDPAAVDGVWLVRMFQSWSRMPVQLRQAFP